MNPDEFKQAWQRETSQTRLTIDADLLLKEVRRNQQAFAATIFWRDVREVGTSLLMVPVWIYLGLKFSLPWTWFLALPSLLWIAGYMLTDRMRQKRQSHEQAEPLRQSVQHSLTQVDHQIRLLRRVLWWYLLPLALPILAYCVQVMWRERSGGWLTVLVGSVVLAFVLLVFAGVYWLNQYAVGAELEPRRRELETLLTSLDDEPSDSGIVRRQDQAEEQMRG